VTERMQLALWEQITMQPQAELKEKDAQLSAEVRTLLDLGRGTARSGWRLGDTLCKPLRGCVRLLTMGRRRRSWSKRGTLSKAVRGFLLGEPFFKEVARSVEDVDTLRVEGIATAATHTKGGASGEGGGGVLWYAHEPDWYDNKAIRQRFRHSWIALCRWDDDEVALELETERELRQRKKAKAMEQMLSQTTVTAEQIFAQSTK